MTVHELWEAISHFPPDLEIVVSCDSEGNGFSPLAELCAAMYDADTSYSGAIYPTAEQIAHEGSGYTAEDEAPSMAKRVVVLWPTN